MTWKRSEEQLEFQENLITTFSCLFCNMPEFTARQIVGQERMRRHRSKHHPEIKEPKRRGPRSRIFRKVQEL